MVSLGYVRNRDGSMLRKETAHDAIIFMRNQYKMVQKELTLKNGKKPLVDDVWNYKINGQTLRQKVFFEKISFIIKKVNDCNFFFMYINIHSINFTK